MVAGCKKIVLIGKFCTAHRTAKCSHRFTMLRFRHLVWHKISSIIDDFFGGVLIGKFCTAHRTAKCSHRFAMLRFRYLVWHKISSIIDDFFGGVLIGSFGAALR